MGPNSVASAKIISVTNAIFLSVSKKITVTNQGCQQPALRILHELGPRADCVTKAI
jgi:hypothetical protein